MAKKPDIDCFKRGSAHYNTEFLAGAFLRTLAFGKEVPEFNTPVALMSVTNTDDVLLAVKKAYIDLSPRTFERNESWWVAPNAKKGGKERAAVKEKEWKKAKERVFAWLADEFVTYFQKGCISFAQWHEELCDEFIKRFSAILQEYGYVAEVSLKYGKAQKIVNMTFKYLFCFDDAREYEDKFTECHMPIDGYILNWYNEISDTKYTATWSDLDKRQYMKIQEQIKTFLGDAHSSFLAEFYIWPEYKR